MTRTFQDIINEMPVGLERSLGRILSQRVGKDNAIERDELLALVRQQPGCGKTGDRVMRNVIHDFRLQGVRICHVEIEVDDLKTGKTKTKRGYYMAKTNDEYQEFRRRYESYARTIWQTIRSMDEKREVLTSEGAVEPPPGIEVQGQLFAQ